MITHYPLLPARPHDVNFLSTLTENFSGTIIADKGFIDAYQQTLLKNRHQVEVITSPRRNMKASKLSIFKAPKKIRKRIETIGSHLTERFSIQRLRVHDLWHFQHRIIRKVLAHSFGVFLNLQLQRSPLDLDGLVAAL